MKNDARAWTAFASRIAASAVLAAGAGLLGPSSFVPLAFAESEPAGGAPEKMDSETHTLVIQKLEAALAKANEDETVSMRPIRARLADLYAERGRLRAMEEAEKDCQNCTGAREDRARAIKLYETVEKDAKPRERGQIAIQRAHLHELQGEGAKAAAIYSAAIDKGEKEYGRETLAQAYMGRGETRFAKGEFGKAKPDFEQAIRLSPPHKRGYATYRVAWCELNLGEQAKATKTLVRILKTPSLMSRQTAKGPQFDESFQEDVSRDLASFLARGPVGKREIALLSSASPERAKRENLRYLATECERLGSRESALYAWDAFIAAGNEKGKEDDRLEAMIHVARIRYEMGHKQKAVSGMAAASDHWNKHGCLAEPERCESMRSVFRRIPLDWHRAEKKKPTAELLGAYKAYLRKFDEDVEMTHWAALVAREIKANKEAAALFVKTSILAHDALAAKKSLDGTGKPATEKDLSSGKDILESSSVGAIEMAEAAKDPVLREQAYDHYLKVNPYGVRAMQVRYQRARVPYEAGNNLAASARLHAFATSSQCRNLAAGQPADPENKAGKFVKEDADLCVKAADLDLDALALAKQDGAIEAHALEYASMYPARRGEYARIARKAALNQVAKASNDGKASSRDVREAMEKLNSVSLVGASTEEQISYWKNRLKLAEKARDLAETERAADGLLGVRGLSAEDREYALARKLWAAEMALDFATAYRVGLRMQMPKLSKDERLLRLALLAELAGRSPRQHEEEFLRTSRDLTKALAIRAKIARDSRNPVAELRRQGAELERHPSIYAPLALEIFARTQDYAFAERALRVRGVAQQPAGGTMARYLFLRDFSKLQRALAGHRIRSSSEALLGRTLSERIKMVNDAEEFASRAVRARDWTLQLATLATLSRENKRLYDDIMALPTPRRLKAADRQRYITLVSQKAQPFKVKHEQIDEKLAGFWGDSRAIEDAAKSYERTRRELRPLLAKDIQAIASAAPQRVQRRLRTALADDGKAFASELAEARLEVQKRPFDARSLQKLRELEEQNGRDSMVAYLDARIAQLKQGESQ